jgi:acyl-homoserine lactone acylase PvdQ
MPGTATNRVLIRRSRKGRHLLSLSVLCVCLAGPWALAAAAAFLPGTDLDSGKTVVYRDLWGVPHIYAPTVEAGLYAMGWAQAQDRPEELLKNMLRGMGQLASVEGPNALDLDRVALMLDVYAGSQAASDRISPEVRRHLQAFVRGINSFYEHHPADVPSWWRERQVDEFMVIAYGRLFLQSYAFDDGLRDLKRAGIDPGIEPLSRGSNQFAVAPGRSALHAPILLCDMHLPWEGPYRFWEFRIHAGNLRGSGFTLAGLPYIGLGHNEHVAWSLTTGGPDAADAYELQLDSSSDPPTRYLFEGQWRELKTREYKVHVKGVGEEVLRFCDSHHGPLVATRKGKGYAIKTSYADEVDVLAPWHEFNFAADYRGVQKGLALLQLFPHNVMVADDSGNIYYERTGRVPRRPAGCDGALPVDGSTSGTEWLGLHPSSDLLRVTNPPQGYMQNCNVPPDAMMEGSPFSLERTIPYMYADLTQQTTWGYTRRGGWTNSRGARAVQLLKADSLISPEEAMSIAQDIRPFGAPRWVELLIQADEKYGTSQLVGSDYDIGIQELRSWNFELAAASRPALKYAYWRIQLMADIGGDRLRDMAHRVEFLREPLGEPRQPSSPSDEEMQQLVSSFARAMARLRSDFATLDKTYGDVFRVGRGDLSWPCDGGMSEWTGLTTLRSVGYGPKRPDHTRWAQSGQTSTGIVVLTQPIQSWTCLPLGQSSRPDSPHYRDQAEKLFSPRRMKSTWWTPEELAAHIESRTVLDVP